MAVPARLSAITLGQRQWLYLAVVTFVVLPMVLIVTFLSIWHFLANDGPPHGERAKRRNTAASAATTSLGGEATDVDSSP